MTKPALFIVDSDANDLAGLAAALTRRYGATHDISTAASWAEAITKLAETDASLDLIIVSRDLEFGDPQVLFDQAAELQPCMK